jgi:2-polyprenyl-3-methyl-5-hydroxy-6-metoxy-1,4-benzoquinol methylase
MNLLSDRVRDLWSRAQRGDLTTGQATAEQARLTDEYAAQWRRALLLADQGDLQSSIVAELAEYYHREPAQVRQLCTGTENRIADAWRRTVDESDPKSIDRFYDQVEVEQYTSALMWWHTLVDDNSPLAYVGALDMARQRGARSICDFGAGCGSGAVLYAAAGLETAAADISAPMLAFTKWRCERRKLKVDILDLRARKLPEGAFDFVSALDVFEHLSDPVGTVDDLARSIRPGGVLFGRFAVDADDDHPLHIVRDFGPVFERLAHHGFSEVWRDDWLWGHKAFARG